MVKINSSFEDNEKSDQGKLEVVDADPDNCCTENEDPNFPVRKAVQTPGKAESKLKYV